jgi:hypothetical protein
MDCLIKHLAIYTVLLFSSNVLAGGPLVLEGPDGTVPVTYRNPVITLNIENGDLRLPDLTNSIADGLVEEAFTLWNMVDTASIQLLIDQQEINEDIDIFNYDDYLPNASQTVFNADDDLNPVVYDSDGKIIDAFFGAGQSDYTVGFSASILIVGSSYFKEGYAVINGKDLGLNDNDLVLLIAHEIGHFFGLDHSQVNINNQEGLNDFPYLCRTAAQSEYPVMYPFACREDVNLHPDDISALSALYPAENIDDSFGILQGYFKDQNGIAILGANIWVENNTTGETYSMVSDYRKQGNGFFRMRLPAGNYTLHANSVNTEFFGGSGVGPYSLTPDDRSFTCPHPITAVTYLQADNVNPEVITISSGQTVDISFSGSDIDSSQCETNTSNNGSSSIAHLSLLAITGLLLLVRRLERNFKPLSRPSQKLQ